MPERIFLTGYMGAGKSTIGRLLAARLTYEFKDTDQLLVRQFKQPVAKIFQTQGEAAFRKAEVDLLQSLATQNRVVVATGGGTLSREETFTLAFDSGLVIYLHAPVEVLYERAIFSRKERPLLNVPNPEAAFRERFAQREPFYTRAQLRIETYGKKPEQVVAEMLESLSALHS